MPISPIAFSDSAKALLSVGGEVDYRNAASRAYYCMYHSIQRKVLSQCNNIPPVSDTHLSYSGGDASHTGGARAECRQGHAEPEGGPERGGCPGAAPDGG